jgi:hypothetical protein
MPKFAAILLAGATLTASLVRAQVGVAAGSPAPAHLVAPSAPVGRMTMTFGPPPQPLLPPPFPHPAIFLGSPFFPDYQPLVVQPATPQVIVVQTRPAAVASKEEPGPVTPLLIEWQGDRYVRLTGNGEANARVPPDYTEAAVTRTPSKVDRDSVPKPRPRELPPAELVFRDGHHEEVGDYAIIDGVIYARGDYWTSGAWTKRIPLAGLDLPATIRVNKDHGVNFVLPAGPNEVVTRP